MTSDEVRLAVDVALSLDAFSNFDLSLVNGIK